MYKILICFLAELCYKVIFTFGLQFSAWNKLLKNTLLKCFTIVLLLHFFQAFHIKHKRIIGKTPQNEQQHLYIFLNIFLLRIPQWNKFSSI